MICIGIPNESPLIAPIFQRPSSLRDWDPQRETDLGLTSEAFSHRRSATGDWAVQYQIQLPPNNYELCQPFNRGAAVVDSLGRKSQEADTEDNSESRGVTTVVYTRAMEMQKMQLNKHLDVRHDLHWHLTNHHSIARIFQRPSSLRDWDRQRETDLGLTSEAFSHRRSATGDWAVQYQIQLPPNNYELCQPFSRGAAVVDSLGRKSQEADTGTIRKVAE